VHDDAYIYIYHIYLYIVIHIGICTYTYIYIYIYMHDDDGMLRGVTEMLTVQPPYSIHSSMEYSMSFAVVESGTGKQFCEHGERIIGLYYVFSAVEPRCANFM
jgi:hypothetical protein